jgi:tetratricopeptide (TPR) repeat protein
MPRRYRSALMLAGVFAVGCASPPPKGGAHAVIRTTTSRPGLGPSKFASQLERAQDAAEGGRFEEATGILDPILAEFDALPREGVVYTVGGPTDTLFALMGAITAHAGSSKQENPEEESRTTVAVMLDPGFVQALSLTTFIQVERKQYDAALETIAKHEAVAPSDPGPTNERGFLLVIQKRPEEALAAYTDGLQKARLHDGLNDVQAVSLRGIGIALIDLGRLAEAKQSLLDSLSLDPGNHVANHELEYIEKLEGEQRSGSR